MLLSTALRAWVTANHDMLSADDRAIVTDLAAEVESGEFAHLTTDLSVEHQVTVVAVTSIADRQRVGHLFRTALHWHATGGSEAAEITKPPVAGALPPTVHAPPMGESVATPPRPTHAPGRRPPAQASPAPTKRPFGLSEGLFWFLPLA